MMPPKTAAETPAAEPPAEVTMAAETAEALTLDQWAEARSKKDRRVELLNGFVTLERAGGRFTNTEAGWNAAYIAFANRPI